MRLPCSPARPGRPVRVADLASLAPLALVGMEDHAVIPVLSVVRHHVNGGRCPERTEGASGRAGHEGVYLRLTPEFKTMSHSVTERTLGGNGVSFPREVIL